MSDQWTTQIEHDENTGVPIGRYHVDLNDASQEFTSEGGVVFLAGRSQAQASAHEARRLLAIFPSARARKAKERRPMGAPAI